MTPQEEARERAELLIAFADGAQLQHYVLKAWRDWSPLDSPLIQGPKFWRIKPEPRRLWTCLARMTNDELLAKTWGRDGQEVIEWQEVVK